MKETSTKFDEQLKQALTQYVAVQEKLESVTGNIMWALLAISATGGDIGGMIVACFFKYFSA